MSLSKTLAIVPFQKQRFVPVSTWLVQLCRQVNSSWIPPWFWKVVATHTKTKPIVKEIPLLGFPLDLCMVYLPTWMVDIYGKCSYISHSHGCYGFSLLVKVALLVCSSSVCCFTTFEVRQQKLLKVRCATHRILEVPVAPIHSLPFARGLVEAMVFCGRTKKRPYWYIYIYMYIHMFPSLQWFLHPFETKVP